MESIDMQRFGQFVSQLRKKQNMTQRELADRLGVSDKAVSKWERALSLPDVALLLPLAECLGVSVTELLQGGRMTENSTFSMENVEKLMQETLRLSKEEQAIRHAARKERQRNFCLCVVIAAAELVMIARGSIHGWPVSSAFWVVEALMLFFGAYFSFGARETLPAYYDYAKLGFYQHGAFRMNVPGVRFTNQNWPYIVRGLHTLMMGILVGLPAVCLAVNILSQTLWARAELGVAMLTTFSIFLPIYVCGKKYE